MRHDATGPIVMWEDYGYEGWQPKSFDTLKEALLEPRYSATFVITHLVDITVNEQYAKSESP